MKVMMQKKYLLVSLVTAAALLSGCSAGDASNKKIEIDPTANSVIKDSGTDSNGLINPSITEAPEQRVPNFEDGKVEVVVLPEVVTQKENFVEVPLGEVSGSVVESEQEVTALYNTYKGPEIRQWVQDLEGKGWQVSAIDTLDTPTNYVSFLTNGDKTIAVYANNTDVSKNTVISFSK